MRSSEPFEWLPRGLMIDGTRGKEVKLVPMDRRGFGRLQSVWVGAGAVPFGALRLLRAGSAGLARPYHFSRHFRAGLSHAAPPGLEFGDSVPSLSPESSSHARNPPAAKAAVDFAGLYGATGSRALSKQNRNASFSAACKAAVDFAGLYGAAGSRALSKQNRNASFSAAYRSGELSKQKRSARFFAGYPAIQQAAFVLVILLAVGCVCAPHASGQGLLPDERQNIVHGTVVNSVTHEAIGRALVYSPDNRFATLTDGEGHFEFALPKAATEVGSDSSSGFFFDGQSRRTWSGGGAGGISWLMARKPGFLDDPNERRQVLASPGSELTISLMPEALIKGRVILSTTDAAMGINVQILSRQVQEGMPRWVQGSTVRANSNGEFRFAELLPGAYKLVTHELMDNDPAATVPGDQLYGFPPVYYPSVTDFAAAGTIQLTAGQTFQADLSLVRQPYYPVGIPVTKAELGAGMNITVSVQGHRGPGYSLGYNADKQRIEGLLPNGNYRVEAATFGQNPATGMVNIAVAGAPVEGPSMTVTGNSSVSLNVAEEFTSKDQNSSGSWSDGKRHFSLHGPRLYLQARVEAADDFEQQRSAMIRPPTGPNDDSMVIENLAPGRYWLRVTSSRGYIAAATMAGVDLLHQPLVVGSGSSTPVEITMRDDNAEIEGTVTGGMAVATASGGTAYPSVYSGPASYTGFSTPLAYVYSVPLPDSPGQFQQLWASAEGKFNSQTMAPGTYRILAFKSAQPNLPYRDAEAMRAYETKGQVVHLSAGQKATVQVQIISSSE